MHQESLFSLASTWRSHILEVSPETEWPSTLLHTEIQVESSTEALEDDWIDLGDFGPIPDDMLELDDQHAAFLEDPEQAEEDEVERLVTRIEAVSEERCSFKGYYLSYTDIPATLQAPLNLTSHPPSKQFN